MSIQPAGSSPPIITTASPSVEAAKARPSKTSATQPVDSPETQQQNASKPESVSQALHKLNSFVSASSDVVFTQDEDTGTSVVKVVDHKTKEVIRQMPSEEVLQIAKALDKLQGLLVRDKA